jgi:hypothetical protein
MKRVIIFTLLGIFLLFAAGAYARMKVFPHFNPVDKSAEPPAAPGDMSWKTYSKVKQALGSFDLVNGLTKQDLQSLDSHHSLGFYYLVACLWLVVGMRFKLKRPQHKAIPGTSANDGPPSSGPPPDL